MGARDLDGNQKTVTAAATSEALASAEQARAVDVTALPTNVGYVYVNFANGTRAAGDDLSGDYAIRLSAGDNYEVPLPAGDSIDLADILVDVSVSGEGVSYGYCRQKRSE